MLVDYHLHTVFSRHAVGSIEDYLGRAEALKIEEVCFTEHVCRQYMTAEIRSKLGEPWLREHEVPIYFGLLDAARAKTSVDIKQGLEVDYVAGCEKPLEELLGSLPLDFVLGTIHFLPAYQMQYIGDIEAEPVTLLLDYFAYAQQAIESGLFDSLAHLHLGWQVVPWPDGEGQKAVEEALAGVVAAAGKQDMCLEINTRAFNFEGYGQPRVYRKFLQMIADYDVPVTMGSDAHDPQDVGRNYPAVLQALSDYGIDEVATFQERERQMVRLGGWSVRTASR
ncbi:MAG: histidinol-phosphatase HisJ family protein [Firmicutes bacterium]|nr:histidinol-phosphatase HisJ family protein [Bacillota bacterium]